MEIKTLKCQNCGAPLRVDESQKHITCPYCGITNIVFEEYLVKENAETTGNQRTRLLTLLAMVLFLVFLMAGVVLLIISIPH